MTESKTETLAPLSKEDKDFLSECEIEFADRFTDSDRQYKEEFDKGIPEPPIVNNWFGRPRRNMGRRGGWGGEGGGNWGRNNGHQQRDRNYTQDNRYGGHSGYHKQGQRYYGNRNRPY